MLASYHDWLEAQKYEQSTVGAQLHRAGRVEKYYGDLDQLYQLDRLEGVLASLRYSTDDARHNRPNPSKIPITGDVRTNLASYKDAILRYIRFRTDELSSSEGEIAKAAVQDDLADPDEGLGQRIGLERDLQASLRRSIHRLEDGLVVVDDGAERSVASGFIDITAKDAAGQMVVIELKAGTAGRAAVGQILSYMGDIADEEPTTAVRGILVAADFDIKAQSAARMVPSLQLRRYSVQFQFSDGSR